MGKRFNELSAKPIHVVNRLTTIIVMNPFGEYPQYDALGLAQQVTTKLAAQLEQTEPWKHRMPPLCHQ